MKALSTVSRPDPVLRRVKAVKGCLEGTLIGDTLGLPYEKLPSGRGVRLLPFPLRQRLFFGRGIPSDDTCQSFFVAQALLESKGDEDEFVRRLARLLRIWFLAGPPGIGLATIKACSRLCIGISPSRSGVKSAGNGAAMRSAVIGAYFANDEGKRIRFVELSTKITHTDRLALDGAQLIALAAATSATGRLSDFDAQARALFPEWDFDSIGDATGPTGYVLYSVNVTLQFWKEFGDDPKRAIEEAIRRGGDTDTVGAMLGGILGASPGCSWHEPWKRTFGFPTVSSIENLPSNEGALYFRLLLTNLVALPAILLFGFRRLLPPY